MANGTCEWTGISGTSYTYHVHNISWRPGPNQNGNYIFAKVVNGVWQPVYIGQGNLQERYDAAIKEGCVTTKGATNYHVHLESDQGARELEEADLIAGHPTCMEPTGCNDVVP